MAYEQRENSGSLFKNDKREKESQPNARGTAKIGGVDYWVDAWTKKDKNGKPWQSLSFKRKDQTSNAAKPAADKPRAAARQLAEDDVPF